MPGAATLCYQLPPHTPRPALLLPQQGFLPPAGLPLPSGRSLRSEDRLFQLLPSIPPPPQALTSQASAMLQAGGKDREMGSVWLLPAPTGTTAARPSTQLSDAPITMRNPLPDSIPQTALPAANQKCLQEDMHRAMDM